MSHAGDQFTPFSWAFLVFCSVEPTEIRLPSSLPKAAATLGNSILNTVEFRKSLVSLLIHACICRFFTPLLMPSLMSGWRGLTPLTMPGLRSGLPSATTDCITWSLFSLLSPTTSSSKPQSSSATPMPLTCQVRLKRCWGCSRPRDESSCFQLHGHMEN